MFSGNVLALLHHARHTQLLTEYIYIFWINERLREKPAWSSALWHLSVHKDDGSILLGNWKTKTAAVADETNDSLMCSRVWRVEAVALLLLVYSQLSAARPWTYFSKDSLLNGRTDRRAITSHPASRLWQSQSLFFLCVLFPFKKKIKTQGPFLNVTTQHVGGSQSSKSLRVKI